MPIADDRPKISVFLTREQHRDAKILAMDNEMSLSQFVAALVVKAIDGPGKRKPKTRSAA